LLIKYCISIIQQHREPELNSVLQNCITSDAKIKII
jgi:hypothetical protein